MSSAPLNKIVDFLRRQLLNRDEDAGPESKLRFIKLGQMLDDGTFSTPLHSERIRDELDYEEDEIFTLADNFLNIANSDAEECEDVRTYLLVSFVGLDLHPDSRSSEIHIRSRVDNSIGVRGGRIKVGGSDALTASKDSLIVQQMRHNEALMRVVLATYEASSRRDAQLIERLSNQTLHYQDKHFETITKLEELKNEEHDRAVDLHKMELSEERKEHLFRELKPYLKLIASKFLTGKMPDDAINPEVDTLMQVFENLSGDQLMEVQKIIGSRAATPLLALYQDYLKRKKNEGTKKQEGDPGGKAVH